MRAKSTNFHIFVDNIQELNTIFKLLNQGRNTNLNWLGRRKYFILNGTHEHLDLIIKHFRVFFNLPHSVVPKKDFSTDMYMYFLYVVDIL